MKKTCIILAAVCAAMLVSCGEIEPLDQPESQSAETTAATRPAETEAPAETTDTETSAEPVLTTAEAEPEPQPDSVDAADADESSTPDESSAAVPDDSSETEIPPDVDMQGEPINITDATDLPLGDDDADFVRVSNTDTPVRIMFTANTELTDFKLLSISLDHIDDDGKPVFQTFELYGRDKLLPERPLCATVDIPGDSPNVGISFKDSSGRERHYSVEMSGFDGSLLLTEF